MDQEDIQIQNENLTEGSCWKQVLYVILEERQK
jgi:hypothetical protein